MELRLMCCKEMRRESRNQDVLSRSAWYEPVYYNELPYRTALWRN